MTIQYLPSPKNYKENFLISLEGIQLDFFYQYNSREDAWYLSVVNQSTEIITWLKLVQNISFGKNYPNFPLTKGELKLYSPSNNTDDANLENFGTSVYLIYESS